MSDVPSDVPSVAAKFTCDNKIKLLSHLCRLGHYYGLWEERQEPCGLYALLQQGEPRRGCQAPQRGGQNQSNDDRIFHLSLSLHELFVPCLLLFKGQLLVCYYSQHYAAFISKVSQLLPKNFSETIVRIYCKKTDEASLSAAKQHPLLKQWKKQKVTIRSKNNFHQLIYRFFSTLNG